MAKTFFALPANYVYPRRENHLSLSSSSRICVRNEKLFVSALKTTRSTRFDPVCKGKYSEPEDGDIDPIDPEQLESKFNEGWDWLRDARRWLESVKVAGINSSSKEFYKEYQSMLNMELGSMEVIVDSYEGLREWQNRYLGEEGLEIVKKRVSHYESMLKTAEFIKATAETQSGDVDLTLLEVATDWETEVMAKVIEARRSLRLRQLPSDLDKVHRRVKMLTVWLNDASQKRTLIQSEENYQDRLIASEWEIEVMKEVVKCRRDLRSLEEKIVPESEDDKIAPESEDGF